MAKHKQTKSKPVVQQRLVRRFRVEWQHTHPMWGEVFAADEAEAVRLAKAGIMIPDTVDSEPGKNNWSKVAVEETPNDTEVSDRDRL